MGLLSSFGCLSLTRQTIRSRRPAGTFWGLQGPSPNPGLGILMNSRGGKRKLKKKKKITTQTDVFWPLFHYWNIFCQISAAWRNTKHRATGMNTPLSTTWYCWVKTPKITICFPLKTWHEVFLPPKAQTGSLQFPAAEIRVRCRKQEALVVYTGRDTWRVSLRAQRRHCRVLSCLDLDFQSGSTGKC